MGLKRRGAPQFLQVKLIDLNFKGVSYFFGRGGGVVLKYFSKIV